MADKKNTIPMCWKCASKVTRPKGENSLELIGCTEESKICNYSDAEKMCPLIKKRVLILVTGGVVTIDCKPDDVEIEIRDYDVEGEWDEENISCKVDDDGDRYQEMIFSAEEKKSEIDKNSKTYKEARWFIDRIFGFDTMSKKEIIAVCEMTAVLAKQIIPEDKTSDIIFQASGDQAFPANKEDEEENEEKYLNYYKCVCNTEWSDSWSCMCDDRCPDCNTSIQCYRSVETATAEVIEHFDPDKD